MYRGFVFIPFLMLLLATSCVPKSTTETKNLDKQAITLVESGTDFITGTPSADGKQNQEYSFAPSVKDTGLTFSLVNAPSWLTVNQATGAVSGVPTELAKNDNIYIKATKLNYYTLLGPFSIWAKGDPLFKDQWYIQNSGQTAYATNSGTPGMDLNMAATMKEGITGFGINVAVSDTGLDIDHPDLISNVNVGGSKNYNLPSPYYGDPIPASVNNDHGTSVAGIIGATAWNDMGLRGVSPGVNLTGLNFLSSPQTALLQLDQASGDFEVFNYSYGYSFYNGVINYDNDYYAKIKNGFTNERGGLGQLYVKAAGNSFKTCDYQFSNTLNFNGEFCVTHSANSDPENTIPYMIVVGALNAKGEKASYSSIGSSLWVSAFGGEYGYVDPAIVTTDTAGCSAGYSKTSAGTTAFNNGEEALNFTCDYTNTMNGTSSATPMISGVIALLLEANPNLTSRDIKYILAKTSKVVESSSTNLSHPYGLDLTGHIWEPGWLTNAAGFHFHNYFGFGLVDVDSALALAKTYAGPATPSIELNSGFTSSSYKRTVGSSIPDNSYVGVSDNLYISSNLTIEAVQIKVNITHPRTGDIGIELTSPSGTKSVIWHVNNSFLLGTDNDADGNGEWIADLTDFVLLSNAFFGESAQGTWTIKVIDGLGTSTGTKLDQLSTSQSGTFADWSINVVGH